MKYYENICNIFVPRGEYAGMSTKTLSDGYDYAVVHMIIRHKKWSDYLQI